MKKSFLLVLLFSNTLFAQLSDEKYLDTYKSAVELYNQKKYNEAAVKFSPLTTKKYVNGVAPYAFLYHALSSENKGSKYQSKVLFRNLLTYYPDWDKINDARLLFGQLNLKEGYFEEGIKVLHEIDDRKLNTARLAIIEENINNVKTVAGLKGLYEKYPNYEPIAKALVAKIQANRYNSKADLELSDELSNRFNFFGNAITDKPTKGTIKKKSKEINLALLLPFETSLRELPSQSASYVYDIYAGLLLAANQLNKSGINFNIHTYDVKSNSADFTKAANNKNFGNLDIIVGPLYAGPNNLAKEFMTNKNTIQVHPMSNNLSLVQNTKNSFLMQPSQILQAQKTLEYVKDLGGSRVANVFYGSSKKDSTFATVYAAEAKKKGYTVNQFKRFNNQDVKVSSGHIFFAGDESQGVKFLQNCALNNIDNQIIVTASSFNWEKLDNSIFTENVSIIYPEFVDSNKEVVSQFEKEYFTKYYTIPSYYSYLGYDLGLYFGEMLKDGRSLFDLNIKHTPNPEKYTLSGYDFSEKIKQNAIVPIVRFNNDNFEEVYR